jgi:hypothetical protein
MRPCNKHLIVGIGLLLCGCTVDVPLNPAGLLGPLEDIAQRLQNDVERLVGDPLGSKPFPVIIGGDSERLLYATNLGDIRLRFSGPINDFVLPGLIGPSNVYEIQNNERALVRVLTLGSTYAGLATDGRRVAYIDYIDSVAPGPGRIVIGELPIGDERVLYEATPGAEALLPPLILSEGRIAVVAQSLERPEQSLRVITLDGRLEYEITGETIEAFDLQAGRLAVIVNPPDAGSRVVLRDLATGTDTELASGLQNSDPLFALALTNNQVVWSEVADGGLSRIRAFDITTGQTRTWVDAAEGELAGASDTFFVMQELNPRTLEKPDQIIVRRFDAEGRAKKLADFRADGLAGQATILGDRVVFVNDERRIVVVPLLRDEDRRSYAPF